MSLLSILPYKLLTSLSIIDATRASPARVNPSFPVGLVGVHLVRLCIVNVGFHHQRTMNNVVLSLSHSSALKLNELQRQLPKLLFNVILHYSDVCLELQLTFLMCACFF